jgi:hypothetical protein
MRLGSESTRLGALALAAAAVAGLACEQPAKKKLYFREPVAPVGVGKVTIVSDHNANTEAGGEVTVVATVEPEIDRDELDRLLSSFHRQVRERRGFARGDRPQRIVVRFYTTEAAARAGGGDWLAELTASGGAPEQKTNRQKAPLLKWAKKVLGKQPEFSGALKPQLLADPNAMALELTIPYVADDGSGKYVEKLGYVKAITEWVSYTRALFERIPELKKFTFVGRHNDAVVMKIWLTRSQYNALNLQQVEEGLGAFQGQFIEPIMSKQISEKAVEQKVIKQRRKVYRETLGRLPKEQVELDQSLR